MNLRNLYELQNSGALRTEYTEDGFILLGGSVVSKEQSHLIASRLGWEHYELDPVKIIDKTNKFVGAISKHILDEYIVNNTVVSFQNKRKVGTMSYFDRIKIVCNKKFDLTIIYNMPGLGGKYAIFSSTNNFKQPVKSVRTIKEMCNWINSNYTS